MGFDGETLFCLFLRFFDKNKTSRASRFQLVSENVQKIGPILSRKLADFENKCISCRPERGSIYRGFDEQLTKKMQNASVLGR